MQRVVWWVALFLVLGTVAPHVLEAQTEICMSVNCGPNGTKIQCNRYNIFPGTVTNISTPTATMVTGILGCWHSYFFQNTMDNNGEFFGRAYTAATNPACRFLIDTAMGGSFQCTMNGPEDGLPVELLDFSIGG